MLKKSKGGNKSMFRTNSRGSKKKITKTPILLKHESSPDDPPVRMKYRVIRWIRTQKQGCCELVLGLVMYLKPSMSP